VKTSFTPSAAAVDSAAIEVDSATTSAGSTANSAPWQAAAVRAKVTLRVISSNKSFFLFTKFSYLAFLRWMMIPKEYFLTVNSKMCGIRYKADTAPVNPKKYPRL
jgi:hypothetical protein